MCCGLWCQEDLKVIELVRIHGAKKWSLIADHLPGRIGKQCRERCVVAFENPCTLFSC